LFFLGILLAIGGLESLGYLEALATSLGEWVGNQYLIIGLIGLASSVVDNVPLVAATMGMYSLTDFPMDHTMWEFLAFCAGTGGSILIIGSASGVAVMGMEKIEFGWYAKKIGFLALIGYLAGAGTYLLFA
jgi:Na+/H+ antiporter NhaD/arsenite permease-like protein